MKQSSSIINLTGTGTPSSYADVLQSARNNNPNYSKDFSDIINNSTVNGEKSGFFKAFDSALTNTLFTVNGQNLSQEYISEDFEFIGQSIAEQNKLFNANISESVDGLDMEIEYLVPHMRKDAHALKDKAEELMQAFKESEQSKAPVSSNKDDPAWNGFDSSMKLNKPK